MSFLPIALIAYILNGFSLIVDKNLVDHNLKNPIVYTFYIGALSFVALLLIPFGFSIPSTDAIVLAVLSGVIFVLAQLTFFEALQEYNASVVSPVVGTLNPVFSLIVGALFLGSVLTGSQFLAFSLLIIGGIILTFNLWWGKHNLDYHFLMMVFSGFLFGMSYVLLAEAFYLSSFINGLVISRLAVGVIVLSFLFFPKTRSAIFAGSLTKNHFFNRTGMLVLSSQAAGAASGLMVSYAITLANPALVNSLFGVQYIMLLVVAIILAKSHPHILDENLTKKVLFQKVLGSIVIALGLGLLAFS